MASHTATGEWKSFEGRMRRRRAERLLVRADLAVTNGRFAEARACLDELRGIAPSMPGVAAVEERLTEGHAHAGRKSLLPGRFAGAALAATAAVAIAIGAWTMPHRVPAAQDVRELVPAPPAIETAPAPAASAAASEDERTPVAVPAALPAETPARDSSHPDATKARLERTAPPLPRLVPGEIADDFVAPPRAAIGTVATAASPLQPLAPPTTPPAAEDTHAPGPAPSLRTAAAGSAVATSGTVLPVTNPEPAPRSDAEVRGTLDRYAAAYNDLDAGAAQRVWPRVNRAALSRAFDSLASQQVSLGDCRIDVRGTAARAACAGSATWAAKIGDATPHTEARRWTFDLVRSGDAWQIVDARVQNR